MIYSRRFSGPLVPRFSEQVFPPAMNFFNILTCLQIFVQRSCFLYTVSAKENCWTSTHQFELAPLICASPFVCAMKFFFWEKKHKSDEKRVTFKVKTIGVSPRKKKRFDKNLLPLYSLFSWQNFNVFLGFVKLKFAKAFSIVWKTTESAWYSAISKSQTLEWRTWLVMRVRL